MKLLITILLGTQVAQAAPDYFEVNGGGTLDYFADDVGYVGDINHDGFDDFIVAERGTDNANGVNSGSCYVVFGNPLGFPQEFDVRTLDGTNGFTIQGSHEDHYVCNRVNRLFDFNGDGVDDVLIGARADSQGSSVDYILFGKNQSAFDHPFNVADINGLNGTIVKFDHSVGDVNQPAVAAGDINADGLGDILMAEPTNSSVNYHVVYGHNKVGLETIVTDLTDGINGFTIPNINGINLFVSTMNHGYAGDLNHDNVDDFYVYGGWQDGFNRVYVIFGSSQGFESSFDVNDLDGSNGFLVAVHLMSGIFQKSINHLGDFNGDGANDLMLASTYSNKYYVIQSRDEAFPAVMDLTTPSLSPGVFEISRSADHTNNVTFNGQHSAGDINADGFDDIVIDYAVRGAGGTSTSSLGIYTILGREENLNHQQIDLEQLSLPDGFQIVKKIYSNFYNHRPRFAGDINGDGVDDLIIGNQNSNGLRGDARVYLGRPEFEQYIFSSSFEH